MDNRATSGVVDLGNSYLARGDLDAAEPFIRRALEMGRHGKVSRPGARAQLSLGSLCEQDGRPAEAPSYIEVALPFYRQSGYSREFIQATLRLSSVREQQGLFGRRSSGSRRGAVEGDQAPAHAPGGARPGPAGEDSLPPGRLAGLLAGS